MDNNHGLLAGTIGLLIGGFATAINHTFSFVAVLTAATTATARYYAVLRKADQEQIERATARGFFFGCMLSGAVLIADQFLPA
jgi:hypothetical protein